MAARLPKAAREYLEQLRTALQELEPDERSRVLRETRNRLATLPRRGRNPQDIIAALGPAETYAANFARVQPEALQVSSGRHFLTRILAWPTFAFALLTAAVLLFAPGASISVMLGFEAFSLADLSFGYVEGADPSWINLSLLPAVLVSLVPGLFSLTPLMIDGKAGIWLQLLGAVVMSAVAVLAGDGIGLFLLPAVVLLWTQVLVPPVLIRNSMGRPGWTWRSVGTVLVVLLGASAVFVGWMGQEPLWLMLLPALLLIPAIGHLMRARWAEIALIACGLGLILYAGIALTLLSVTFLSGALLFIVGHLGLAGNMWNRRSANLLALL